MVKKLFVLVVGAALLSGCTPKISLPGVGGGPKAGSVFKSVDGGDIFEPKVKIDDEKSIGSVDVLSFAFHPTDDRTIYMGTLGSGLLRTTDGAEHWEKVEFPPVKNYGLAIDEKNGNRLFVSGVYENISKIYRTEDAGKNWKEIYTEPGSKTVITALGSQPDQPDTLYAGTSAGVIVKSTNGGETWENLVTVKGAVLKILFEKGETNTVTALVSGQGVITSTNGGETWNDFTKSNPEARKKGAQTQPKARGVIMMPASAPADIVAIAEDPTRTGVIYASSKTGLFRSMNRGEDWAPVAIIESSKQFPIRAIAVNPHNSQEISYASGQAFYRSTDGGEHWLITQLDIDRGVSVLAYNKVEPKVIYLTLRSYK